MTDKKKIEELLQKEEAELKKKKDLLVLTEMNIKSTEKIKTPENTNKITILIAERNNLQDNIRVLEKRIQDWTNILNSL